MWSKIRGKNSKCTASKRVTESVSDSFNPRIIPGTDGVVTGGSSKKLGQNLMESMGLSRNTKRGNYQAQHIIPVQMKKHPVIKKMGMDFDDITNGMFLRKPGKDVSAQSRHSGCHSIYNRFVKGKLDEIDINQSNIGIQNLYSERIAV